MPDEVATPTAEKPLPTVKPLDLAWWEFALAVPFVLAIAIFVAAQAYVSAVVLLSVTRS